VLPANRCKKRQSISSAATSIPPEPAQKTPCRGKHQASQKTPLPSQKTDTVAVAKNTVFVAKTPFTVAESPSSRSKNAAANRHKKHFPTQQLQNTGHEQKTRSPHGRCPRLFSKTIFWDWAKAVHVPNGKRQFRCEVGMPLSTFAVSSSSVEAGSSFLLSLKFLSFLNE
jgi:hypothetical protein